MSNSNKDANLKEKLRQALTSTFKVISGDINVNDESKFQKLNKYDISEINNLNSKNDFIKARAETDSSALKRKFSNQDIYKKNLPFNSSGRNLYQIAEKIRYESLGFKILKGVKKNLTDNYNQIEVSKKKRPA